MAADGVVDWCLTGSDDETAIAAAFKRALKARQIDVEELPKVSDPDAREIFREVRWADTDGRVMCPYCSAERPFALPSRPGAYNCRNKACDRRFSLTSQTPFSSRKAPMQVVLLAVGAAVQNGDLNATRLMEVTGLSYKSALSFAHRLGMRDGRRRSNVPDGVQLYYPYRVTPSAAPGYDLIAEINAALPPELPVEMRADVAQEMALAVLCGDLQRDAIRGSARRYMRDYNRLFNNKWRDISLSTPLYENENGATLGDTLSGERSFEYWERR